MPSLIDVYDIKQVNLSVDKTKVGVIIPAYNEEKSIEKTLEEVNKEIAYQNVYVVNDGSTDNTAFILRHYQEKGLNCIHLNKNRGKAGAIKKGLEAALQNGKLKTIIFLDANQLSIQYSLMLASLVQNGYNFAFGERNKSKMPFTRRAANGEAKLFWTLLYLHHEYKNIFQDPLCGYCAVSADIATEIIEELNENTRFLIEPLLKYFALLSARRTKRPIAVVRNIPCSYDGIKSSMKLQNIVENAIFGDIMIPIISKIDELDPNLAKVLYDIFYKGGHRIYSYILFPALKAIDRKLRKL